MIWEQAADALKLFRLTRKIKTPKVHIVLGSGLASGLETHQAALEKQFNLVAVGDFSFSEIPGLQAATAPGHKGVFRHYSLGDFNICFQIGRLHGYEGLPAQTAVTPVAAAALAGTKHFVLTNAAGGLRVDWPIGTVMMIHDHVNFTGQNPLAGPNPVFLSGKEMGPRFSDMSEPYDLAATQTLSDSLKAQELRVQRGTYVGLLGPSFETPAEVRYFADQDFGTVGMSTVWETIVLKYLSAKVTGCSVVSNPGAGLVSGTINHLDVLKEMEKLTLPFLTGVLKGIQSHEFEN